MASYNYVDDVNTNLICCICRAPFLNPVVTTTCSHTFCRECITRCLQEQPCCPVDRTPLSTENLKAENLLLRNMVDELLVECSERASGCKHTCERQLLEAHLRDSCQFVQVACSEEGCNELVLRKDMGSHSHDCSHRVIVCEACNAAVKAFDLETHYSDCAALDVICPSCSESVRRVDLRKHDAQCPELVIPCVHSVNGCPWKGQRKSFSAEHQRQCPYEAIKGFFVVNEERLSSLKDENALLKHKLSVAESSVNNLKRDMERSKRVLGPWWKADEESSNPVAQASVSDADALQQEQAPELPRYRISNPHPLAPILSFTAESPVTRPDELEGGPSPSSSHSVADLAFLAQYFPSTSTGSNNMNDFNGPSFTNANPAVQQVDALGRSMSMFPYSPPGSSRPYATAPLRFPDGQAGATYCARQAPQSTSVAPIDLSSSIEGSLSSLRNSIVSVSAGLDALARQQNIALTTENLRMNEEVGSLRAIVHGLRMQVHALITERNGMHAWDPTTVTTTRYYNHPPPAPTQPLVINSTTQTTKL
ncbi:hypothetical protein SCHPADRAFT_943800 [Schizopora paradoxa]|uniref:RING-type domain-containing protein n=1 Tax=Schizopora paradoxa TaxID=27342 RepID=A0A0H2RBN4_9AGAM|nr:hypothetical protein SCHPADRAFT_943800 [Schizopora paradoxa]